VLTLHNVHYRHLNRTSRAGLEAACCPVPVIMSFDSHLVVSHVVVTAIASPDDPSATMERFRWRALKTHQSLVFLIG
jgi:hypothetical protein